MLMLIAAAMAAGAQTPPIDPELPSEAEPCIPVGEIDPNSMEPADDGTLLQPCEDPAAEIGMDDMPDDAEEPATEASVEEEFKPGDEISEDYPVPLPADI
jgi:hypothetical protein